MADTALRSTLRRVVKDVGGYSALARVVGLTYQAIQHWDKIPAERVVEIAKKTKFKEHELRPDLYKHYQRVPENV